MVWDWWRSRWEFWVAELKSERCSTKIHSTARQWTSNRKLRISATHDAVTALQLHTQLQISSPSTHPLAMDKLPFELVTRIIEAVAESEPSEAPYPQSHIVTRTLHTLLFVSRAISAEARKQLFENSIYISDVARLNQVCKVLRIHMPPHTGFTAHNEPVLPSATQVVLANTDFDSAVRDDPSHPAKLVKTLYLRVAVYSESGPVSGRPSDENITMACALLLTLAGTVRTLKLHVPARDNVWGQGLLTCRGYSFYDSLRRMRCVEECVAMGHLTERHRRDGWRAGRRDAANARTRWSGP